MTNCILAVSRADVAKQYEDFYNDNDALPAEGSDEDDALQEANDLHQNWIAVPAFSDQATVNWTGAQGPDEADSDYRAGAWITCDYDGEKLVAFAYEPTDPIADFIGSVEGVFNNIIGTVLGSVGSSGPAADDDNTTQTAE